MASEHEVLRTTSESCRVHRVHIPTPHQNHVHHIFPLGMGGEDVPSNTVIICPTGHFSVHYLLKEWLKDDGDPGSKIRKTFTKGEQYLAEEGFRRYKAKISDSPVV